MLKTKVKLREKESLVEVKITSKDKKKPEGEVKKDWQRMINLVTKMVGVRAGLIMEITEDSMRVFLSSESENNPYSVGGNDTLCHGLYCETVIGTDSELSVPDARKSESWKGNPDVKLNMISYYGLPIKWPDGEFFGTICVLDDKEMYLDDTTKNVIKELKYSLEKDLEYRC